MSARIVPLSVLCFLLPAIFYAVVATAQEPAPAPLNPSQQIGQAVAQNPAVQAIGAAADATGGFLGLPPAQPLPTAPFTLTPEEETNLNRVLVDWQNMSGKVSTFESDFVRWDYDGVFGAPNVPARVSSGVIKYAGPDKGSYEHWQIDPKTQQKVADEKFNEKWICTGDAVFQFRYDLKQVREHKLPENMRGKAIADGPMPFVFGVEAVKMRQRYWIRVTTPQEAANQSQVWLEAYPKEAKDAANFYKLDIILTFVVENGQVVKLEPYAINMVLPNQKDRTVYRLSGQKANTQLQNIQQWFGNFIRPGTPLTWTHQVVEETAPPAGPESQPAPGIGAVPQPGVTR
jgi:TIGR03009 family protein